MSRNGLGLTWVTTQVEDYDVHGCTNAAKARSGARRE